MKRDRPIAPVVLVIAVLFAIVGFANAARMIPDEQAAVLCGVVILGGLLVLLVLE